MKVFITGGAGFIGSNIAQYFLDQKHTVAVYDNLSTGFKENLPRSPHLTFIQGDVLDREALESALKDCDAVLHLAASVGNIRSIENPAKDSTTNVLGTLNVLEATKNNGIKKFVYSSSAGIFGEPQKLPLDETHPTHPDSPYGVSKLTGELHALCFAKLYGIDAVCLRYFNVYGRNQRFDAYGNVIPIFATKKLKREPLIIYGDGEQTRDFVHVFDVAQANFLATIKKNVTGAYNIGSAKSITINTLVKMMHEIAGQNGGAKYQPPRKGEVQHSLANIEKAKNILGFQPTIDIKNGLKDYWQWINSL